MGADRNDTTHAELNCFFDHPIHFVTGRQPLEQAELTRQFVLFWMKVAQRHTGDFPLKIKCSWEFAAAAIKQNEGAARFESTDSDMVGDRRRKGQGLSGRKGFWAIKAGSAMQGARLCLGGCTGAKLLRFVTHFSDPVSTRPGPIA